jgi:pilus assembly protein CpaB
MQKQKIVLIAGIVLAVVVVVLIKVYLDQQRIALQKAADEEVSRRQKNQTSVLVAKEDIPKGTVMESSLFEPKIVPREHLVLQAVTSADRIGGMVAVIPIARGEQIALTKLSFPRQVRRGRGGGLAEATPVGKRAITINVDNVASVAGMVRPGNYVDILAMIPVPRVTPDGKQMSQPATVPLFQNVLVLAVGQDISHDFGSQEGAAEGGGRYDKGSPQQSRQQQQQQGKQGSLITLALTPQEANLAAFVQEQGKFRLILRSPADSQMQPIQSISWEALFQYLMPKEMGAAAAGAQKPEDSEPKAYVEIYRGLKKEKVPLSK